MIAQVHVALASPRVSQVREEIANDDRGHAAILEPGDRDKQLKAHVVSEGSTKTWEPLMWLPISAGLMTTACETTAFNSNPS